ncbi:hypothetical protein N7493_001641 [Penicillium malachiteum]|uniref:Ankyrin repeat protein n=1 Tax=Penicillium malachiteum TaxID=1324776 RepID=A0AAD6HUL1_9EURO|nr:hypothetical protein N7493_001641 [Penicillium malachiteum]
MTSTAIQDLFKKNTRGSSLSSELLPAAYVPLTILALQHALSLDTANEIRKAHPVHRVDIIRAANGLLTTDKASPAESKIPVDSNGDSDSSLANHHSSMAKLCLKYLDHEDFLKHAKDPESYPFLPYSMEYWGDHVREACLKGNDEVYSRAQAFLLNSEKVRQMGREAAELARKVAEIAQMDDETAQQHPGLFFTLPKSWFNERVSAIHLCAWYNLPELIDRLCKHRSGIDMLDLRGRPPLLHACFNGS